MNKLVLVGICLLFTSSGFADDCPVPIKSKTKTTDPIPLCLVAAKIKTALDDYNNDPKTDKNALPKLSSADFDFKVARSTSTGLTFSILVFNVGATRQVDSTDDVTFSYQVAKPGKLFTTESLKRDQDFSEQLVQTIQAAAKQVKATKSVGDAQFKTLTVNLAYGVKWDFKAGATVPIQLVTIGGNFDRNKTSTQSVKLTFGP